MARSGIFKKIKIFAQNLDFFENVTCITHQKPKKKLANPKKKKNWLKFGKQKKLAKKKSWQIPKKKKNWQKIWQRKISQKKKLAKRKKKKKLAKNWLANFANFPTSILYSRFGVPVVTFRHG